jgi:hypothetical protein
MGTRRFVVVGMVAAVTIGAAPAASARVAPQGAVYGGTTSGDWPVVVEVNKKRTKVVRAITGIRLNCTSGGSASVPDSYKGLAIKKRKFSGDFGPDTQRNDDGTTSDFEGTITGALNKKGTKLTGTWTFKVTDHDTAGTVTDTCDSGALTWKAKQ